MPDPADSAVRELAAAILSRAEFARARDATTEPWFVEWLRRFFGWIEKLDALRVSSPALYWAIIAGFVVVLVLLLAHIVWSLRAALAASAPEPPPAPARRPRIDLAGEAESLAAGGLHLEAAHRLMLASFRALAERSVIELRPDRPNSWIRDAVRRSRLDPELAADIGELVERLERQWFRERSGDPEIYFQWRDAFHRVAREARR